MELILASTPDEKNSAYRLRYKSYLSVNAIQENHTQTFSDIYDEQHNTFTFLLKEHNADPVASIRACVQNSKNLDNAVPAWNIFQDELIEFVGDNFSLVESNRFVTEPDKDQKKSWLYAGIFYGIAMTSIANECSHVCTAIREDQKSFYRKFFGMEPISDIKKYHGINVNMLLVAADKNSFKWKGLERIKDGLKVDETYLKSVLSI